MAHPRLLVGSDTGRRDPGGRPESPDPIDTPDDPIDDLEEWRPPGDGLWAGRLAALEARSPIGLTRAAVTALVVLVVVGAAWWLLRPPGPALETILPTAEATDAPSSPTPSPSSVPVGSGGTDDTGHVGGGAVEEMVVQAAGAVGRPGVYRLPAGSRVDDLVREAAGLTPDADADRVNLASPLLDGERIWIPRVGEEEAPDVVAGSGGGDPPPGGGGDGLESGTGLVNLNMATAGELEALPGIGPATASAILAHRDQIGSFGSIDELIDVRGIGDAKMEQLRPLVTV